MPIVFYSGNQSRDCIILTHGPLGNVAKLIQFIVPKRFQSSYQSISSNHSASGQIIDNDKERLCLPQESKIISNSGPLLCSDMSQLKDPVDKKHENGVRNDS